ncbi:MAG: hypothetical protein ACK4TC_05685 [Sphingomonas pseudosanguinis]|uniref:hypothetical protein n=1 Tax=Sphingomonas pseudosanguinis TaxID=413712 RepID=UPI00391D5688
MGSARVTWHQTDLTRALKAAKNADQPVVRTEIAPDGTISLFHHDAAPAPILSDPFDAWRARRDGR